MAAQKAPPAPRALGRSRSANAGGEESVYALGAESVVGAAPKIRTYNLPPPGPSAPSSGAGPGLPPTPKQRSHADSSQIESIFNPVRGPRDAQVRAGIKPVNHASANVRAVKEQSQMNALRKISESSQQSTKLPPVRSTSAPTRRPLQRMPSDAGGGGGGGGRDFLMENKLGAGAPLRPPRPERRDDDGSKYLAKKDYGKVPTYLVERKMEMLAEQEAKERAKEAAMIPPGMRLLPEDERLETLAILQKNKDEVERAIQQLPLRIETPSAIRRKDELERRLKEIDDAFKIFSRPKVIVHI